MSGSKGLEMVVSEHHRCGHEGRHVLDQARLYTTLFCYLGTKILLLYTIVNITKDSRLELCIFVLEHRNAVFHGSMAGVSRSKRVNKR